MTTRHRRLQELFARASEQPADERQAFLDEACGDDDALRAELDELLLADAETCLLDRESDRFLQMAQDERSLPIVENYRLIDRIGSGGMGDVYRAHQLAPVQRTVALKVLRRMLLDGSFTERFTTERQLVARLQHTGIAQLFESGVTDDGCPYFAMEFVEGEPITRFCDAQELPLRERLRLFTTVCEAVQHAHQQGIVHRDIKPANVLTKLQDGRPLAKVIDFGIAHSDCSADRGASAMGTPGYSSPESHSGNGDEPTSDVYSLGVLLRELICGQRPNLDEASPARCSELVASMDDAALAARGVTRSELLRACHRELDFIVAKATAPQADDRYPSPAAFADDVRRHLERLPVQARPASFSYRITQHFRRNRTASIGVGIATVGLAIAVGAGLSAWFDRQRARDSIDAASRAVFERSIDSDLANLPGSDPARIKLLRSGLELSEQALAEQPDSTELQARVMRARTAWANLLVKLGRLPEARSALQAALADDVANAGDIERARPQLLLVTVLRRLDLLDEADAAARTLQQSLPVAPTDPWIRRTNGASAWREVALNARRRNQPERAIAAVRKAIALIQRGPESGDQWPLLWKRVDFYKILAEFSAEVPDTPYREFFEVALTNLEELRRDHSRPILDHLFALLLDSWAAADVRHERFDDVESLGERATAALEPLLRDFPERVTYQETWLRVQRRSALLFRGRGERDAAVERLQAALDRGEGWLAEAPDRASLRRLVELVRREREQLR